MGHCRDESTRAELCNKLQEVAKISRGFFEFPPLLKLYDQKIGGNILLSSQLVDTNSWDKIIAAEKLAETSARLLPVSSEEDLKRKEKKRLVHSIAMPEDADLFSISNISVYGIEFPLQNYYYPDENVISFVFLSCPNPGLDGLTVQLYGKKDCRKFESKIIRKADWLLGRPSIHLRYHCEQWTDFFLGWVKRFYIPDLYYWRYDELPGFDRFSKIGAKDKKQKEKLFLLLVTSLGMECTGWPGMKNAAKMTFWEKLTRLQKRVEK
jgi:hypothetical protein